MPNFKKLAKVYEHNAILALQELVHRESVYDPTTIGEGAPYGKGVKSALDYVAKLGKDYGFEVDTCEGYCTELSFGEGNGPLIGIYAHSDVVPVSGKWDNPPFGAKITGEGKNRIMWGRGTSDDKGPLIAVLYAVKLLKDNGLIKNYRVRLVAGGDEERGSSCLEHYFHSLNKPDSDYGFTPDAEFPLIYAEKGISHFLAKRKVDLSPIVAIDGGFVANAVCDKVLVTIPADKKFAAAYKDSKEVEVNEAGPIMIVTVKGKTAHGSTPELGDNAAVKAFKVFGEFYKHEYLLKLSKALADVNGKGFDGFNESPELGKSTWNIGIIKYKDGILSFTEDFRYGETADKDKLIENFQKATEMAAEGVTSAPYLLYDKKGPLVSTLMKSYRRMTWKLFDKPMAIGGGTYAKEAKNCVAYGSAFKDHPGDIHSPNEYIYIDDFLAQIAIYADAIHSLGQLKK